MLQNISHLDFEPSDEYVNLKKISDSRKFQLLGEIGSTLSYRRLGRRIRKLGLNLALHHYVPRYRLKGVDSSVVNQPSNILLLTVQEHLIAHYYLYKFETGNYGYSAKAAFIQMFNLNKNVISEFSDFDIMEISKTVSIARTEYYGSPKHIEGSRKAGKIAGQKRKDRFASDEDFKNNILNKLHSEGARSASKSSRIATIHSTPHWDRINGGLNQEWKYFDTIYTAVLVYDLSYKILAKILGVKYPLISNIVTIIKHEYKDDIGDFTKFKFYNEFNAKYKPTLQDYLEVVKYFSNEKIPWKKPVTQQKPWYKLKEYFEKYSNARNKGFNVSKTAFSKLYGKSTSLHNEIHNTVEGIYNSGVLVFEEWEHFNDWMLMRRLSNIASNSETNVITKRYGVHSRGKTWFVTTTCIETSKLKLIPSKSFEEACHLRDAYEMNVYGELLDISLF